MARRLLREIVGVQCPEKKLLCSLPQNCTRQCALRERRVRCVFLPLSLQVK